MKRILFLILLFASVMANAQTMQEVVYLKNGSVIKGIIIEQTPNESLKIQTADGSIFAYNMEEVDKITKEVPEKQSKSTSKHSSAPSKYKEANENGSVQFGIRVGMNVSNMKQKYSYGGESDTINALVGYHVGFIVDVPLYKNYFYIQPGLYLTQKGYKYSESYGKRKWEEKLNPTYLEIPILLSGRYTFGIAQLQLNFGPYLACGLFGKDKYEESYSYTEEKDTDSENIFGGDDGFKRFDAGLSLGAGVLLSRHYYIGFQYEFGLANILPSEYSGKEKNRNFMLSVGYNF